MKPASIWTLLVFDWKQLSRQRTFGWLTGLMLITGLYAAWYGQHQVQEQWQKIGLLRHDIDSSMHQVGHKLARQDTMPAWQYDDFLFALHSNPPDGLAALAFGQRDIHKFAVSITLGTYFYNRYAGGYQNKTLSGELANPQKQFIGHLDVSFVLVFLLPLYLILLSYNGLSSEQEGGTLVLLAVQQISIRRLLYTKLALRGLLAVGVGWLICLVGAGMTGALGDSRLVYFLGATLLYMACWAGIVALIVSFRQSSSFNALALIGVWLLVCVILPAAFTAEINAIYPAGTKSELITSVQQANARVFGRSHPALAKEFYRAYPQFNTVPNDTFPGMWYNPRWMRAAHRLLDRDVEPHEQRYQHQLKTRIEAADKLDYYSPALLAQSVLNRAAASDMGQMYAYNQSIYEHFARWRDFLDDRIYRHQNRLTKAAFNQLPRDDFKPIINYWLIDMRLSVLLLMTLLFFTVSTFILTRRSSK